MTCSRRLISRALATLGNRGINSQESEAAVQAALSLLEQARSAGPQGTAKLQLLLGYVECGALEQAHAVAAAAATEFAQNPAFLLFKSLMHIDQGEFTEADKSLDDLAALCPGNQALPSTRVLLALKRGDHAAARAILLPHNRLMDLPASSAVTGRVAAALENALLPTELPPFLEPVLELPPEKSEPVPTDPAMTSETTSAEEASDSVREATQPDQDTAQAAPPDQDATQPDQDVAEEATDSAPSDASSLGGDGSRRLQRAWSLPDAERRREIALAVQQLEYTYRRSPKAFQAAFNLGEGLLASVEYCRDRSLPLSTQEIALLRRAEDLFTDSLENDSANAYAMHYLARSAFLQKKFALAEREWRRALACFEKLPEAHYGLGQMLLLTNRPDEGRHYIVCALSSDLHLLRERIHDWDYMLEHRPEAFAPTT